MTECTAEHLLDREALTCHLEDGHAGPHKGYAIDGDIWWQRDIKRRRSDER